MGLRALSGRTPLPASQLDSILEAQECAQSSASTSSTRPPAPGAQGSGVKVPALITWSFGAQPHPEAF